MNEDNKYIPNEKAVVPGRYKLSDVALKKKMVIRDAYNDVKWTPGDPVQTVNIPTQRVRREVDYGNLILIKKKKTKRTN